jgi:hypothetical protein
VNFRYVASADAIKTLCFYMPVWLDCPILPPGLAQTLS